MKQVTKKQRSNFMNINVILTFTKAVNSIETQEFFDIRLHVRKNEIDAITFLNQKFFKLLVKKCKKFT